jgi:hypothetical protein
MKETDTFLSDLGAEMLAVFNHKIADWVLTNPIELPLNTEGGAGLELADFQRFEKILALPIRAQTDFIPNDLFDFDGQYEYVEEQSSPNEKRQNRNVKSGYFSENKRLISERFFNDSIFANPKNRKNEQANEARFSSSEVIKAVQKTSEMLKILRGGKEVVFENNKEKQKADFPQNEEKDVDKSFFLENETPTEGTIAPIDTETTTTSSTIWQKPLGNLGAFAALSNAALPISEKLPKSVGGVEAMKPILRDETTVRSVKEDRVGAQEKTPILENETAFNRMGDGFNTQNARIDAPSFLRNEATIQPENIDFIPIGTQGRDNYFDSMTDTDDLFDALIERIKRDFQRFYP